MKKVSIIVPVYNASDFLTFCIENLLKQTYPDLEIILVDDGSTDNSPNLCDSYLSDTRIKVLHQTNQGASSARNNGLKHATGQYVLFIDSDDFCTENMIETLVKNIENTNSDLSACYFMTTTQQKVLESEEFNHVYTCDKKKFYSVMATDSHIQGYIWNKLYKMQIIKKMQDYFLQGCFEDFEFNCRYVELCKKICYTDSVLYFYYLNTQGITKQFVLNQFLLDGIRNYKLIYNFYKKNDVEDADLIAFQLFIFTNILSYREYVLYGREKRKYFERYIYQTLLKSKKLGFIKRSYVLISGTFPIFSERLKGVIKKWKQRRS